MIDESVMAWLQGALASAPGGIADLPGATTARVISMEAGGVSYVLKLFDVASFVAESPDRAIHEATVLEALEASAVPAPRLIAVDGDGSSCGFPAVLMTSLPGVPGVSAVHAGEIVDIAARLHAVAVDLPWRFVRYNQDCDTRPPAWGSDRILWSEALALAGSDAPPSRIGLVHRDFNSTNFLTRGDQVTGIVDWLSACHGPPAIDAARLRLDLAVSGKPDLVGAITAAFRTSGHDAVDPFWDVVDAVDLLPFYHGLGAVDKWSRADPVRRRRLEQFIGEALRALA